MDGTRHRTYDMDMTVCGAPCIGDVMLEALKVPLMPPCTQKMSVINTNVQYQHSRRLLPRAPIPIIDRFSHTYYDTDHGNLPVDSTLHRDNVRKRTTNALNLLVQKRTVSRKDAHFTKPTYFVNQTRFYLAARKPGRSASNLARRVRIQRPHKRNTHQIQSSFENCV